MKPQRLTYVPVIPNSKILNSKPEIIYRSDHLLSKVSSSMSHLDLISKKTSKGYTTSSQSSHRLTDNEYEDIENMAKKMVMKVVA